MPVDNWRSISGWLAAECCPNIVWISPSNNGVLSVEHCTEERWNMWLMLANSANVTCEQGQHSLPDDVARSFACSIVGLRLDYCNSLRPGTSKSNLRKLQRVRNTLSRVTLRQGKFAHNTPVLKTITSGSNWTSYILQTGNIEVQYTIYNTAYWSTCLSAWTSVRLWSSPYSTIVIKRLLTVNVADTVLAARGSRHSAVAVWNSVWHYSQLN